MGETTDRAVALGRWIVADPEVCHGELTFRGTRIFVKDVLEAVARGRDWQSIREDWNESFPEAAIAEAVRLAAEALFTYKDKLIASIP